jgi:hypothetical protein
MMSRFQRLLRTARHMFSPYHPPKRPVFAPDEKLELRRAMQRDLIGDREVMPLGPRIITESQPDTIKRGNETVAIDWDGLPNG